MEELYKNFFVNLGAIGIMIAGLAWFSRTLFTVQMQKNTELEKKYEVLENEFREYLKTMVKEQHEIIEKNTDAYNRFVTLIEVYLKSKA